MLQGRWWIEQLFLLRLPKGGDFQSSLADTLPGHDDESVFAHSILHKTRKTGQNPMPLLDLDMPVSDDPVPADICRFIEEAEDRIDQFQTMCRVPGFVPSDYIAAYGVLRALSESTILRGRQFCEWGSGFGVVTCLAAMVDFEACGIEIERMLVDEARSLADDFGLSVEFVQGSFVPPGAEDRIHASGIYSWLTTDGDYAYEDLELNLSDMDVIFAYPWPDEEAITGELFECYAGIGAVLVTYHGGSDFRLRRKRGRRSPGSRHRPR